MAQAEWYSRSEGRGIEKVLRGKEKEPEKVPCHFRRSVVIRGSRLALYARLFGRRFLRSRLCRRLLLLLGFFVIDFFVNLTSFGCLRNGIKLVVASLSRRDLIPLEILSRLLNNFRTI